MSGKLVPGKAYPVTFGPWTSGEERVPMNTHAALRPARVGGFRRLTFDNGRHEDYQAVFVQHESGEWDRILIARDDGTIARLLVDLINSDIGALQRVADAARVVDLDWTASDDTDESTRRYAAALVRLRSVLVELDRGPEPLPASRSRR